MQRQVLATCALLGLFGFGCDVPANSVASYQEKSIPQEASTVLPAASAEKAWTIIWGAGAAVGNSDGQFANAFVQASSFSPGNNPDAWTALTVNQSGGATLPGNAFWTRSLTGVSQGAYATGIPVVSSPSQANGVAIFDSDFLDNAGVAGAFGTGSSPSPHRGELISPRIDLTGHTNARLIINMYSFYRSFVIAALSVSMSTDDGATWTSVDYRQFIASNVQGFINVNFFGVTAGVANLSQCRIKLVFDGDAYFAIIDDLSILRGANFDVALGVFNANGNLFTERGDVIQLTGNRYFPISQLVHDDRHFSFGGTIKNVGAQNVLPSSNPVLGLSIEKNSGGVWTSVFTASTPITETIPVGGYVSAGDSITDYTWVSVGDFRAIYTASMAGEDGDLGNNSLTHFFSITPDNYASKTERNANGDPAANGRVFPAGGSFTAIEYGSVFYFNAATSRVKIDSIAFRYYVATSFSPIPSGVNQTLWASVYTVDASSASLNNRNMLTWVGVCPLWLIGLGTAVPRGSYGVARCVPIDVNTGEPLGPLSTGQYFISVRIGGGAPFTASDVPFFATNTLKNYNYNLALSEPGKMISVSPLMITDGAGTETVYSSGFGAELVPSIAVELSAPANLIFGNGFE